MLMLLLRIDQIDNKHTKWLLGANNHTNKLCIAMRKCLDLFDNLKDSHVTFVMHTFTKLNLTFASHHTTSSWQCRFYIKYTLKVNVKSEHDNIKSLQNIFTSNNWTDANEMCR